LVAAGALVAALATAAVCLAVAAGREPRPPAGTPTRESVRPTEAVPSAPAVAPREWREHCVAGARAVVCRPPGAVARVDYSTFEHPDALRTAYRERAGAPGGGAGGARCERGQAEERSWSRPQTPAVVAGRYRCDVVGGVAHLWWTVDDARLLAHAFGATGTSLAELFVWWTTAPEPERTG
jgi:hypothetical protein